LVIKALDPDWIRIGVQSKMLHLDPDLMNADPQPWVQEITPRARQTVPDVVKQELLVKIQTFLAQQHNM
jgi:hypothetical protein